METIQTKKEINKLKVKNLKLKTRIQEFKMELKNKEDLIKKFDREFKTLFPTPLTK